MNSSSRHENKGVGAVRGMFLFALLAAFAVMSVIVVLVGARVYRAVETRGAENYNSRTVLSYIAGKVRALDAAGSIGTAKVESSDALVLGAEYGGEAYATYIYVYDGKLMEYFGRAEDGAEAAFGEPIAEASGFEAEIEDGVLSIHVSDPGGKEHSLKLYLQCGEVEV